MPVFLSKQARSARFYLAFALGLSLATPIAPPVFGLSGASIAYADDDDDDDDNGGGYGRSSTERSSGDRARNQRVRSGNLMRYLKRQLRVDRPRAARRQARRPAPRAVVFPAFEPRQLVATGLSTEHIDRLQAEGYTIVERTTLSGGELVKLQVPAALNLDEARDRVRTTAPAAILDFNHFYEPSQNTACGGKPCVAPSLVSWPGSGDTANSCRGAGVKLGLIDTAINPNHATFAQSRIRVFRLDETPGEESTRQHGTAVASLLVGAGSSGTPGLVPEAQLFAVDVFRTAKGQDRAEAYDLIKAMDMLHAEKIDVVNMSLSGPDNMLLKAAVERLSGMGALLVAAAGNDGPKAAPLYPAAYDEVIAVTAVDRGKVAYRRANRGDHIDIAAPGVGVWAAASISGAKPRTGTSFAAPFVAAAAALGKASGLSSSEIRSLLEASAMDLGDPGKDATFGWGLLNAKALCRT